jgi:hypoxanthine phosphoribosyltransferase
MKMNSRERSPSINKILIPHSEFLSLTEILAEKIQKFMEENYKFEYIYPIPRGGLSVALYLSHYLNIGIDLEPARANESYPILVVDDVVDTGKTLDDNMFAFYSVKHKDKFATLITKPWSQPQPDFFAKEMENWIVWDWENFSATKGLK